MQRNQLPIKTILIGLFFGNSIFLLVRIYLVEMHGLGRNFMDVFGNMKGMKFSTDN